MDERPASRPSKIEGIECWPGATDAWIGPSGVSRLDLNDPEAVVHFVRSELLKGA